MHNYARFPVEFVRGEGAALWDSEGNEYLDFLAGISVCNASEVPPAMLSDSPTTSAITVSASFTDWSVHGIS